MVRRAGRGVAAQIGVQMQQQAFIDVRLGLFYQPTACRKTISGVLKGLPLFWKVQRS